MIGISVDGDGSLIPFMEDGPVFVGHAEADYPVIVIRAIEYQYGSAGGNIFSFVSYFLQDDTAGSGADLCILAVEAGDTQGFGGNGELGMAILQLFQGG